MAKKITLEAEQERIVLAIIHRSHKNLYQPGLDELSDTLEIGRTKLVYKIDRMIDSGILGKRLGARAITIPKATRDWYLARTSK